MAEKSEKKTKKPQKGSGGVGKFFRECRVEWKKIVWPTVKLTFKNFGVVLSSIITVSIFVGGLDYGLTLLLKRIMEIV